MVSRYNDVDLMILRRWDEVNSLRTAFDDLLERIENVLEVSLQKATTAVSERKLSADFDAKQPSIWFWKQDWQTRKKEPGIYFQLLDFAPLQYGRVDDDYPSMWLMTDGFSRLKIRESSEEFGRILRGSMSQELLKKWDHDDADLSESPLGRECTETSESDRVRFVADPEALVKFIIGRLDEFMELAPAIDQALQKMTRR
jgi:hypothetical protein